jgi:hypothetical protein
MSPAPMVNRLLSKLRALDASALAAPAILAALLFSAALTREQIEAVWRTGAFFDSDDAMRAVELRDFLAGQGWFDLVAHRLDPPTGQSMHWSRIVDVALAAIDRCLAQFLAPETAERATRLVFPAALLAALLALSHRLGALLAGAGAGLAAILMVTLSAPMFLQFAPGRIDHHGPQIVTLLAAFLCLAQGLDPARPRRLGLAAALMAFSLAISLENLPLFLPMAAAVLALFVVDGARAQGQLAAFAAGALVAAPALYVATVPGALAWPSACDAFTFVHVAAFMVGALSLLALSVAAPRLTTIGARALAALAAGAATAATVLLIAPKCLGAPMRGIDPLIGELWLSGVREARPLYKLAGAAPETAIAVAAPVALGVVAALLLIRATAGLTRRRWIVLAAAIATGAAAGTWQVRVFTSVTPLAMAPLAALVVLSASRLDFAPSLRAALAAACLVLLSPIGLLAPIGLALLLLAQPQADAPIGGAGDCLTPEALAPLAQLPSDRVLASFNLGPFILAHTSHSVFAAPYHRNNHGNRLAADIFLAEPEMAEALARSAGVGLVVWCPAAASAPPDSFIAAAPDGLAARLARGAPPAWLEKKSRDGDRLLVFAVRRVE